MTHFECGFYVALVTTLLILGFASGCATLTQGGQVAECRKLCSTQDAESYKDELMECVCRK